MRTAEVIRTTFRLAAGTLALSSTLALVNCSGAPSVGVPSSSLPSQALPALVPVGGRIDLAAGQVYLYTEPINVPSGTIVDGHGATIEVPQGDSSNSLAVITASHANNITIKNLRIRCNGERSPYSPQRGIFFDHVTGSTISNVVIDSPRTCGIRLHHGCTGNTIEKVTVTMKLDPVMAGEPGIPVDEELVGIGLVSATADQYNGLSNASLDRTLALPATTLDNKVLNCRIYGGKHGIMLYNASRNTISGNSISWTSHRGILLSPTADDNVAEWNDIREYGSTGIHMAWGASRNTIRYNSIGSDHTIWQRDGIKGYLGTTTIWSSTTRSAATTSMASASPQAPRETW